MRASLSGLAAAFVAFAVSPPAAALELKLAARLALADAGGAAPAAPAAGKPAAANAAAKPAVPALQPLIATVLVNGVPKGELVMYLLDGGGFLVARKDMASWVALPAGTPTRLVEGEPQVSLAAVPGTTWRFDEGSLTLRITFPPEAFPAQRFTYDSGKRAPVTPSSGPSALLNYRLGAFHASGSNDTALSLNAETRLSWNAWLFSDQHYATRGVQDGGTQRGLTALSHDDPARLARFTLGDAVTSVDDLAGGVVLGGLTYAKAYELDPYLIHQPTAGFRTIVDTPSQVDVYAGGNRIYRQAVGPGPLEVGNLAYLTGQRDLRVVVRDAFGRERVLDLPFYFGSRALAPGLQEFSYSVGAIRENFAAPHGGYGQAAFSAAHRVGLTANLTVGGRAEGTRDFVTAGPTLVLRADRLGEASLAFLATTGRSVTGTPHAVAASYSYLSGGFGFSVATRRAGAGFRVLQPPDALGPARADDNLSISYSREHWGTWSAFTHRSVAHDGERTRSDGIAYSLPIRRELTLQASWRRTTGALASREFFVGVQYVPFANWTAFASARSDAGSRTMSLQAGNLLPEGEGASYRLTAERTTGDNGSAARLEPEVVYQGRHATLEARVQESDLAGTRTTTYDAAVSGALAWVGGHFGASRPVEDSFALVRIEPPVPDVRVYLNRQELGRTDASGEVFVPRVVSYVENHLSIDDRDVPIERMLVDKDRLLVPGARRGDVVTFSAPQVRAVTGILRVRRGGREVPLELTVFAMDTPAGPLDVPIGRGGEFYVENVAPGAYRAHLAGPPPCDFTVTIPDSHEAFIRLEPIVACARP